MLLVLRLVMDITLLFIALLYFLKEKCLFFEATCLKRCPSENKSLARDAPK